MSNSNSLLPPFPHLFPHLCSSLHPYRLQVRERLLLEVAELLEPAVPHGWRPAAKLLRHCPQHGRGALGDLLLRVPVACAEATDAEVRLATNRLARLGSFPLAVSVERTSAFSLSLSRLISRFPGFLSALAAPLFFVCLSGG